jgi:hypothetical protein
MSRENYRLSEADLDRLVNSAGAANDLSDAVQDLIVAHYEIAGMRRMLARAPHEQSCGLYGPGVKPCDCWKSKMLKELAA